MAAWKFGVRHAIELYWAEIRGGSSDHEATARVMEAVMIDQEVLEDYVRRGGTVWGFPDGWGGYMLPE